jgi:type I restriction enzyme S subunit
MGEVLIGKALAVNAPGQQRSYLRTKNVFDGRIDVEDVLTMPMTDAQFQQFRIIPGDVLLNEGQSLELVGRCAMYQGEYPEPCAIQNQLLRFRARAGVSAEFSSHLFRYCQQTGVFARIALQTTSIAHLGGTRFERLLLPWPENEQEQRAIAEALSNADQLIEALDRLITKKRAIKLATMQQLLSGKTRLRGFTRAWRNVSLAQFGKTYGGLAGKSREDFGRGEAMYVPFLNIINNVVLDTRFVEPVRVASAEHQNLVGKGDIFFNGSSETAEEAGMCSVLQDNVENVYLNSFCFGFRFNHEANENPLFLAYYFRSGEGRRLLYAEAQGAIRYNISKRRLLKLPLRIPSRDEQDAIVAIVSDMDAEIVALEHRRDKTNAIKQGTMQQLLTGRTRLV